MYIDRRLDQLAAQGLASPWSVAEARRIVQLTSKENLKAEASFFGARITHQVPHQGPDLIIRISAMGSISHQIYTGGRAVSNTTLEEAISLICPRPVGVEVKIGRPPGSKDGVRIGKRNHKFPKSRATRYGPIIPAGTLAEAGLPVLGQKSSET